MVEHGLENSTFLTFLRGIDFDQLSLSQVSEFLELSYNNLVDWHVFLDSSKVNIVYNRSKVIQSDSKPYSEDNLDALLFENLSKIISKRPNAFIGSADEIIISNITKAKKSLFADQKGEIDNYAFSDLINSVILLRVLEDRGQLGEFGLLDSWLINISQEDPMPISAFLTDLIDKSARQNLTKELISYQNISKFNHIDSSLITSILNSFYSTG